MGDHPNNMRIALEQARQALDQDEFPVGCAILLDGRVLAATRRINSRGAAPSELDHAEILALRRVEALGGDRMAAATAGDDYELLFAAYPDAADRVAALGRRLKLRLSRVGRIEAGAGVALLGSAGRDVTPARLGWIHSKV